MYGNNDLKSVSCLISETTGFCWENEDTVPALVFTFMFSRNWTYRGKHKEESITSSCMGNAACSWTGAMAWDVPLFGGGYGGMVLMELPPHELSTTRVTMEHHRNSAPSRAGVSNTGQHQNASECCSPFQSHLSGLGWGLNELLPWRKHLLSQAINHCLAVTLMLRKYTTCGFKQ